LSGGFKNFEPESQDTDEWALNNGYVTIVPIQVDITDYARMGSLKESLEE
jgi:5'-nucleotidase